jgi:thiol-disulfide isomerase/thioredoxin
MANETPPPYFQPPPPIAPFQGVPEPPTDTKATISLILGIFSMVCMGFVAGVPAIVLGVLARRDSERSGGMVGGSGVALAGIITGAVGSFIGLVWVGLFVGGIVTGILESAHPPPPPPLAPVPTVLPTPAATGPAVTTTIQVVDITSATKLKDQLAQQQRDAVAHGETVLVQTTATLCGPCRELEASLGDAQMEAALANVVLVRIDIDKYESDLKANRMFEPGVPWFYRLDGFGRPADAISADEWDDNIPVNMAPVLGAFVKGTYTARRHAAPIGTAL